MMVTGSISGSAVTVEDGGILVGAGMIGLLVAESGGSVAPGASPGTLSTGSVTFESGSQLQIELGGTGSNAYDLLNVTGSVTLAGDAQISLFGGFTPQIGDTFFVIVNDGSDSVLGSFANAVGNMLTIASATFSVDYAADSAGSGIGNDVALTFTAIPEPGALALLGSTALLLGLRRRRG